MVSFTLFHRKPLFFLLLIFSPIFKAFSSDTISYSVAFPNAIHHEANIEIEYDFLESGEPLTLNMSRSSPGRYAMHMFGKNVYDVKAVGVDGKELKVDHAKADQWIVKDHEGYVKFKYTLFADYADGTYSGIDKRFAHFNIPASFIWAKGQENVPIRIKFDIPEGSEWKVATQLKQINGQDTFFAPDFQYFMDSPTVLANYHIYDLFDEPIAGQQIRMAIYTNADSSEEIKYAKWAKQIALEQKVIFGEFPQFDFNNYTFICNYGPGFHGDGMEHRNSTIITSSASLPGNALGLIGTVSHEFFHCWSVERLRPQSLEPFDFRDINTSGELWFAEGFTSYYGPLTLCRSNIYDIKTYLSRLSGSLNYVLQSPGTGKFSPVTMSKLAPFVDAASNVDETNFENTFTSYYPYGAMIGLALDLSLRERFENITLDDYMKLLWQKFGKDEIPYTNRDLLEVLVQLTGDDAFSKAFFNKYIFGSEVPGFSTLLMHAGLELKEIVKDTVTIGDLRYRSADGGLQILSKPLEYMPAYKSGLERGDVITKIDTFNISSETELESALKHYESGDTIQVEYIHSNATYLRELRLSQSIDWRIEPIKELTDDQEVFRRKWLGSKRVQ